MPRHASWFRCLLLASLCCLTAAAQIPKELVYRSFDIRGLSGRAFDEGLPDWELPLRRVYLKQGGPAREGPPREETRILDPDMVTEIIQRLIPEGWDTGEGQILRLNADNLVVRNSLETVQGVEEILRSLSELAQSGIVVDVLIVEADHATLSALAQDGGRLPAPRFRALQQGRDQGLQVIGAASATIEAGRRGRLVAGRVSSFVGDYNVEVAQTAQIADPVVMSVRGGVDLAVRPLLMADGRINLRIQGELVEDLKLEKIAIGGTGIGALQLPSAAVQKVACSVVLENGEGLIVGAMGGESESHRVLVVRAMAKAKPEMQIGNQKSTLRVYDLSFLLSPPIWMHRLVTGRATGDAHLYDRSQSVASSEGELEMGESTTADEVVDFIRSCVHPEYWESEGPSIDVMYDRLWIYADSQRHAAVQQALAMRTAEKGRFVSLETYVVSAPRSAVAAARTEAPEDWVRRVLRAPETTRRYTAVVTSDTAGAATVVCGREAAYLVDWDVEIAQGSSIADPIVDLGFSGLLLRLEPRAVIGRPDVEIGFDLELSRLKGAGTAVFHLESIELGGIQAPEFDTMSARGMHRIAPTEYAVLAECSLPGSADDVVMLIVRPQWIVPAGK